MTDLPKTTSFRNLALGFSPTSLQGPNGQKFIFAQAVVYDALADAFAYAVRFRFPTIAPDDAMPFFSQDRQIDRGPNEPVESFIARLLKWRDTWLTAGSARSVINQLSTYFTGFTILTGTNPVTVETVNDLDSLSGGNAWNVGGPNDPPTNTLANPPNWNWDGFDIPGRAWVIIYNGPWTQTPVYGDGTKWGDGHVWGFSGNIGDAPALKSIVKKWKSAGCSVVNVIIAFDPTWFLPSLPPGDAKLPDGNWKHWGKVVTVGGVRVYVAARSSTAVYLGPVS